ncbi:MAG TPA: aldo/keto reductase [Usitatibacter sp.]|nr:aldo/keto reductase [Usitatibacter sp.]
MDRREALGFLGTAALAAALPGRVQGSPALITRAIPSSGERIPVVGLGTWITFDVGGAESPARRARGDILAAFFEAGGRLVDSSPMYGSAEEVIGAELARLANAPLFSATKVWTVGGLAGRRQMEHSRGLWRRNRLDLMQVHNLLDWESHWPTLKAWKAEGRFRYIGMTTSHGRRHDDLEKIIRRERLDFVQLTYNMVDREVEDRLLPAAAERGAAVIVNRPFDGGALFGKLHGKPLPGWAKEIGCATWAAALLKWIASHAAVTCAIPATSQLAHLRENVAALQGPLPDAALRRRMLADYERA